MTMNYTAPERQQQDQSHLANSRPHALQSPNPSSLTLGVPGLLSPPSVPDSSLALPLRHSLPTMMRSPVSGSLTVNQPGDPFEQEADRVADQVMRMPDPVKVHRMCAACAEEEKLHRKCAGCEEEEDKNKVHRKETGAGSAVAPPIVHEVLNSPGQPLDPGARAFFEPRFGHDFSRVRVHTDAKAAEAAQSVNALAYTVGNDIVFGQGRYASDAGGHKLLAHELTHVVQQGRASVAGATQGLVNTTCDDARVQRDGNQQCPSGRKTVTVDLVSLRGSSRPAPDDLDFAQSVFSPCCISLQMGVGVTPIAALSDRWLGGDTIMNRATTRGAIDPEQTAAYDGATGTFNLSGRIRAFYVEDMNPSIALATSFPSVWATGPAAPYEGMVIVTNSASRRSLAHEIGHVLLNADGAVHRSHPGGASNLMEPTATATGETLEPAQCATVFANA